METHDTDEPLVKNAVRCSVCGSPTDRYSNRFQCQASPGHFGDLFVGIFTDLTYPKETPLQLHGT